MYRSPDSYAHGVQIDAAAEAELAEWAFAQPCEEPEFHPVPRHPADFYPVLHADERSLRQYEQMADERDPHWERLNPPGEAGVFGG